MTQSPKEKAEELVDKFYNLDVEIGKSYNQAIKCAKIAVDEIIKARTTGNTGVILDGEYWQEVKQELEKM